MAEIKIEKNESGEKVYVVELNEDDEDDDLSDEDLYVSDYGDGDGDGNSEKYVVKPFLDYYGSNSNKDVDGVNNRTISSENCAVNGYVPVSEEKRQLFPVEYFNTPGFHLNGRFTLTFPRANTVETMVKESFAEMERILRRAQTNQNE